MREPHNAGCLPIRFNIGGLPIVQCDDPTLAEQPLFERARRGEAVSQLWQAPQGFVVPGSYRKFANLATVSESFAARGWPVWMRRSGGGLVPQGPGILNLSLAWPVIQPLGEAAEPIYLLLCGILQRTLSTLGVESHFQAVSGSFCDGRYNLACGEGENARKIAGTAQYWRPVAESQGHIVLAHAVILLDADLQPRIRRPMISRRCSAAVRSTARTKRLLSRNSYRAQRNLPRDFVRRWPNSYASCPESYPRR